MLLSEGTVKRIKKVIEEAKNYLGGERGTREATKAAERKKNKQIRKEADLFEQKKN